MKKIFYLIVIQNKETFFISSNLSKLRGYFGEAFRPRRKQDIFNKTAFDRT